eukprot:gene18207-biopygen2394
MAAPQAPQRLTRGEQNNAAPQAPPGKTREQEVHVLHCVMRQPSWPPPQKPLISGAAAGGFPGATADTTLVGGNYTDTQLTKKHDWNHVPCCTLNSGNRREVGVNYSDIKLGGRRLHRGGTRDTPVVAEPKFLGRATCRALAEKVAGKLGKPVCPPPANSVSKIPVRREESQ